MRPPASARAFELIERGATGEASQIEAVGCANAAISHNEGLGTTFVVVNRLARP